MDIGGEVKGEWNGYGLACRRVIGKGLWDKIFNSYNTKKAEITLYCWEL